MYFLACMYVTWLMKEIFEKAWRIFVFLSRYITAARLFPYSKSNILTNFIIRLEFLSKDSHKLIWNSGSYLHLLFRGRQVNLYWFRTYILANFYRLWFKYNFHFKCCSTILVCPSLFSTQRQICHGFTVLIQVSCMYRLFDGVPELHKWWLVIQSCQLLQQLHLSELL